jgi:hypothetical protein
VIEYCISVATADQTTTFPERIRKSPADWDFHGRIFWKTRVVIPQTPLPLLVPERDMDELASTRVGDDIRHGILRLTPSTDTGQAALQVTLPLSLDSTLADYTVSLVIKDRIAARRQDLKSAYALRARVRGIGEGQEAFLTLVEADGTSWGTRLAVGARWEDVLVLVDQMRVCRGVMLPEGFPGHWNYWSEPAVGRGGPADRVTMEEVERLQISMRPARGRPPATDPALQIESVTLLFQ